MAYAISVDIGSTYTKGALFGYDEQKTAPLEILAAAVTPTTVENLPDGYERVAAELRRSLPLGAREEPGVFFSS